MSYKISSVKKAEEEIEYKKQIIQQLIIDKKPEDYII